MTRDSNGVFEFGCRIPKDYFTTTGVGESDITIHAGSYHLALKDAGIEMCNIMCYSSILPKIANEIDIPKEITHGCVMESITAVANNNKGKRATAGIIYAWLYDKITKEKYGGLVCEYNGDLPEQDAIIQLKMSLNELYFNGYSEKFELGDPIINTKTITPKKKYGTAIVALCFTSYTLPVR